jgi:hypothetical protein
MIKTLLRISTWSPLPREPEALANDVAARAKVPMAQVKPMLAGAGSASPTISRCGWAPRPIPTASWTLDHARILTETGVGSRPRPTRTRIESSTANSSARPSPRPPPDEARRRSTRAGSAFQELPTTIERLREVGTLKALNVSFRAAPRT